MFVSEKASVVLITEDPMLEFAVRHLFGAEHGAFDLRTSLSFDVLEQDADWSGIRVVLAHVSNREEMERVEAVHRRFPGVPVLCWCSQLAAEWTASLRNNCDGVISRLASGRELIAALSAVAGKIHTAQSEGETRETKICLTYRESQLMTLLARGYKNKEIAACLDITAGTVKVYLSTLFKKTGAKDRFELTLFGMKNSLYGLAEKSGPIPLPIAAKRSISRAMLTSIRLVQPRLECHVYPRNGPR